MSTLPDYVEVLYADYGEEFDPSVERTEMERGVPKQRLINSQVLQQLTCSLLFDSPIDARAFEQWYFTDIKRIGFFDMAHPATGEAITARFQGGSIGKLSPRNPTATRYSRPVVLEYMR